MQPRPIRGYYTFGTAVRFLLDAKENYPVHDRPGMHFVVGAISDVLRFMDALGLQVTERVAAGSLTQLKEEVEVLPEGSRITADQAHRIAEVVRNMIPTLHAELAGFEAYVVSPKRIDVNKLLKDVAFLFHPGVFEALPDIARYDLSEAGKCIAYERPTAAAFHVLRATESVLRELYCHLIKRNRAALMWGPMVHDLRNRRAMKGEASLLNNLDDIRLSFRNPTQHPEKTYDIEEVQDLWARCTDAINRMAKLLRQE